jgi:hypothetical protein
MLDLPCCRGKYVDDVIEDINLSKRRISISSRNGVMERWVGGGGGWGANNDLSGDTGVAGVVRVSGKVVGLRGHIFQLLLR